MSRKAYKFETEVRQDGKVELVPRQSPIGGYCFCNLRRAALMVNVQ
jgi:hypothetical protein